MSVRNSLAVGGVALAACLGLAVLAAAAEPGRPQVLILHSYHKADWTDSLLEGIQTGLGRTGDLDLAIEYMDTKRMSSDAYFEALRALYAMKYAGTRFDVVVCTDDAALSFALAHREGLFGGAPLVFCGVNEYREGMLNGQERVAGVVEKGDFADTLAFAFRARPHARRVYVIVDTTRTARVNLDEFVGIMEAEHPTVAVELLDDLTIDQLGERLAALPSGSFAFFLSFWQDGAGAAVSPARLGEAFHASAVPVFGRSEWMIGRGLAGGKCVRGQPQGEAAGRLAARFLAGGGFEAPTVADGPNQFVFDYARLAAHGIPRGLVPPNAVVINDPPRHVILPTPVLLSLVSIVCLLGLYIVSLVRAARRLRAAARLVRASEERFRGLVEATSDWIWETDAAGKYIYVSPQVRDVLGYTPAEMIGRTPFEFMLPDDARRLEQLVREMARQPRPRPLRQVQNANRHKDGRTVVLETSGVPIVDEGGRFLGYRGIDRDITDRLAADSMLRQAQKMEAVGQLAGGVAHDFNNMLGGIMGAAELLLIHAKSPEQVASYADVILKSAERASDLTHRLLAFSRKGPVVRKPVDVHAVVLSAVKLFEHGMDRRIRISLELGASGTAVAGDAGMLQNAVLNLCINSRDAMEEGGSLTIRTRNDVFTEAECRSAPGGVCRPGPCIRVEVRDTGAGMTPEVMRRLFEPFFTTKDESRGTGLGLAAVYATVQHHGGTIAVASRLGEGSVFTIGLPLSDAPPERAADEPPPAGAAGRIFIVDDEEAVRAVLAAILEQEGYRVVTARDGEEALEVFGRERGRFDAVVLDMLMPRMNGEDCFRALRRMRPDIRVIMSSGFSRNARIDELEKEGLAGYLAKPYRSAELLKALAAAIGGGRGRGPA